MRVRMMKMKMMEKMLFLAFVTTFLMAVPTYGKFNFAVGRSRDVPTDNDVCKGKMLGEVDSDLVNRLLVYDDGVNGNNKKMCVEKLLRTYRQTNGATIPNLDQITKSFDGAEECHNKKFLPFLNRIKAGKPTKTYTEYVVEAWQQNGSILDLDDPNIPDCEFMNRLLKIGYTVFEPDYFSKYLEEVVTKKLICSSDGDQV